MQLHATRPPQAKKKLIEIPVGAEREYLILFGVAAIYVATTRCEGPWGCETTWVGVSRDIGRSLTALRKKWPDAEIVYAFWVEDRATAKAISVEVNKWAFPCPSQACQEIEAVAALWQVTLTDHNVTMARVRSALHQIETRIAAANNRGELAWFNKAYRSHRSSEKNFGRGMGYTEARARLRNEIVKQLKLLGANDFELSLQSGIFPVVDCLD